MQTINIKKQDLREAVQKNADKHHNELRDLRKAYRSAVREEIKKIEAHIDDQVTGGVDVEYKIKAIYPTSHIEDYERVISMIDLSSDDIIELQHHEFDKYVLDVWHWVDVFNLTKASYGVS